MNKENKQPTANCYSKGLEYDSELIKLHCLLKALKKQRKERKIFDDEAANKNENYYKAGSGVYGVSQRISLLTEVILRNVAKLLCAENSPSLKFLMGTTMSVELVDKTIELIEDFLQIFSKK